MTKEEIVSELLALKPIVEKYEDLQKELKDIVMTEQTPFKAEHCTVSITTKKTFVPKVDIEYVRTQEPLAIIESIDVKYLQTLPNAEDFLEVKESQFATLKLK